MTSKWVPKKYMKRAVRFLVSKPAAGLFLDPGLGKTSIVLAAFKLLQKKKAVDRMLVIAPLHCCHNVWPAEVLKWDDFRHLRVVVLHGPKKNELLEEDADIFVINPEGLEWLKSSVKAGWWPEMLVVDESTKFKHSSTKRFKLMKKVLPLFSRRVILTGTPAPNGYLDLFGQLFILDLGEALGAYITHYRNNYFTSTGFMGFEWRLLPGAEEEIEKRIAPMILRMSADEYLDLPKRTVVDIKIDLPPKARAQYNRLENDFFLRLDDGEIRAFNAGAQSMKLRQLTQGAVYDQDRTAHEVHKEKLIRLGDLVEEIGQPVIIVYEFQHDYDRICSMKQFRNSQPPTMSGASGPQTKRIVKDWNAGSIPVLCMHPASGGHGLNLQEGGHHMIFFGLTWNLEHFDQVAKRIDRPGQKNPTFFYRIIAEDTIDEVVLEALSKKDKKQRSLLGALRRYRNRR